MVNINSTANSDSTAASSNTHSSSLYTMTDLADIKRRMKYDIESLQAKAADLERAAIEARRKEEELVSALHSLENLSSAIFALPDELLALIFELLVEGDTMGHTMSKSAGPWIIAQTCRRWRQLALSTPSLWTLIRVHSLFLSRQPIKVLKTWLERSQGHPLSCLLYMNNSPSVAEIEDDIFQLVLENSYRWRHLEMDLDSRYNLYSRIASSKALHFPLLQSLRIFVDIPGAPNDRLPLPLPLLSDATLTAPSLTDVSLLILAPSSFESILALPWSQLTELSISFATSTRFNEIMTSLKRVERCYLQLSSRFVIATQIVQLSPSLRRLELAGPLLNIINALSRTASPGLVELALKPPGGSTALSQTARRLLESIAQLQTRSSCQLRRMYVPLTLFSFSESPRIAECLSTVQALHLRLEGKTGSHEAIRTIKTSDIFRDLKELHLIIHKDGTGEAFAHSLPEFVGMVEARRSFHPARRTHRCTQLQCLDIDTVKSPGRPKALLPVSREVAERLTRLERDGLIFLGYVDGGEWHPQHPVATHWDMESNERHWARFGFCNWFFD
ncbi:hypothetical protein PM082_021200 [Marasmius tenuissimus]|nr:hypothetical protein PM082_021200 [Marasmius tenuissimus]